MVQVYAVNENQGKDGLNPVYMITDGKLYYLTDYRRVA
jgi:hypothetical protein